jgi:hypothetical protein
MPITINQTPSKFNLAQSPIAYSVIDGAYASSSFYYTCTLQIWTGSLASSGSGTQYALRKFPNARGYGLFDVSRFVNSSLTNLAYQDSSSLVWFKPTFNFNYESGTSGSNVSATPALAMDGYSIFPEQINSSPTSSYYWPFMTDGPATQSIALGDNGWIAGFMGTEASGITVTYNGVYSNGTSGSITNIYAQFGTSSFTQGQVIRIPSGPGQKSQPGVSAFPLNQYTGSSSASLESYDIMFGFPAANSLKRFRYEIECAYKYTPVRILWKNRYGQFDWINMWYKNVQDFTTEQRVYQPQLGSWNSSQLNYNSFQTATQRYIVDATQTITVNTEFLPQNYNEIFKQLLVSDEVYWMYNQTDSLVKPLTIKTSNLVFKTGVNDKLIQYTFTFDIGQPFKLII